jgi:hypothetical protein
MTIFYGICPLKVVIEEMEMHHSNEITAKLLLKEINLLAKNGFSKIVSTKLKIQKRITCAVIRMMSPIMLWNLSVFSLHTPFRPTGTSISPKVSFPDPLVPKSFKNVY